MLLAELSARFVNLPPERIDSDIEDAQRRFCELLDLDRSTLWQVLEGESGTLRLTHFYQPPGSRPLPVKRMNAGDFFPWAVRKVLDGETLAITKMADLPPEAERDRENFRAYGTRSNVMVPLSVGEGPPWGVLAFAVMREERSWPETVVKGFELIAQVFANALARKRAHEALVESEARLSLATRAAGVGLWIMETGTGQVWVTPKTRELFHFAPEEELNFEHFLKAIHPQDRAPLLQAVRQTFHSGEDLRSDFRIIRPDGSIQWIGVRGQRHLLSTGGPVRLIGVALNITERKQTEEQLRENLREIEMARAGCAGDE